MINNIPKRHFYNNKDYFLDFEKKILILDPEFHEKLLNKKLWNRFGFKKIGGSSVGDVLAVDKYKSQFQAFCRIAWCSLPILDKKYVNAGIKIEPKVVAALKETLNVDIEQFPPEKYNFDYFEDKDEIIGGIPDGYINEQKIIIEIKTTSTAPATVIPKIIHLRFNRTANKSIKLISSSFFVSTSFIE